MALSNLLIRQRIALYLPVLSPMYGHGFGVGGFGGGRKWSRNLKNKIILCVIMNYIVK